MEDGVKKKKKKKNSKLSAASSGVSDGYFTHTLYHKCAGSIWSVAACIVYIYINCLCMYMHMQRKLRRAC